MTPRSPFLRHASLGPVLLALALATSAQATVWFVAPCGNDGWVGVSNACAAPFGPKRTIQAAIAAADDGDEIRVLPGVYVGPIDLDGKAVHLRGLLGAGVTTITGPGVGTVILCNSLEGPDTVIEGFTITGGNAVSGGGMIVALASPTIVDCVFTNNSAATNGGAASLTTASPTFVGCEFMGNSAPNGGGAVAISFGSPSFDGCTFESNAASEGGGLRAADANVTLERCDFVANSAASLGGGVLVSDGTLTATDCLFDLNTAEFGGGFFAEEGADVTITSSTVRRNDASASQGGGGSDESALQLLGTLFEENEAVTVAAFGARDGSVHAIGCTFSQNVSAFAGGGIAVGDMDADDAIFQLCLFEGNLGAIGGGAALLLEGGATFEACTFLDNAAASGGAIADLTEKSFAQLRLRGCTFAGNDATIAGGALFLGSLTALEARRCTFASNTAQGSDGGAIAKFGATMSLVSCEFSGNSADGNGGAVYGAGVASLANCLIVGNSAGGAGGGLFLGTSNGPSEIAQCTIASNTAVGQGDGLWASGQHPLHVANSIVWSNGLPQVSGGAATFARSIVPVGVAGPGCFSASPNFVSAPTGDYRLLASSPAIDAGLVWLMPGDVADLDGDGDTIELLSRDLDDGARVRTASASAADCGLAVDMGAYEFALGVPAQPTVLGDFDQSGDVDAADLAVLLGEWGSAGSCPTADLNGDGIVDAADLAILLGAWG